MMERPTSDLGHLRELLAIHQAELRRLETVRARYGVLDVPLSLLQKIEHHKEQIDSLQREISCLQASIAAALEVWDTVASSMTTSPTLFAPAITDLSTTMCKMMGIVESQRPHHYQGRVFLSVWDVTSAVRDTRLPCHLPVFFVQRKGEALDGNDAAIVRDYLGTRSHLAILLVFTERPIGSRDALEILRRVYAYDIVVLSRNEFESIALAQNPQRVLRRLVLSQIDLVNAAPFVITGPTPDSMFFGRESEMREITEHGATASYAIIGGRRIGKTSILGQLHRVRLPPAGFRTFYYQCQHLPEIEPTRQQLLQAVAHEWLPKLAELTPVSFADILARLPNDKPFVFLIDETDRLIPADQTAGWPFFGELRALAESGRCQFVFAGERTLREAMKHGKSPLFNFANALPIGCLDFSAVEELVTRPMKQLEIELTNEAAIIQRIWDVTSGHPNVVQRLCQRLILRLNERRDRRLTPYDVEAVVAHPTFQRDDFYDVYLEQATVMERILPLVLAQDGNEPHTLSDICHLLDERLNLIGPTGEKPRAAEVDAVLRRLTDLRSILDYTPQGYVFAVKAFPQVIARWGQVTVEDELMILAEKYRDHGDLTEDEIEQMERD